MSLPRNDMFQSNEHEDTQTSSDYIHKLRRQRGYTSVNNTGDNNTKFFYDTTKKKLVWANGYNLYYDLLHGYYSTLLKESRKSVQVAIDNSNCLHGYTDSSNVTISVVNVRDYSKAYRLGDIYDASLGSFTNDKGFLNCEILANKPELGLIKFDTEENTPVFTGVKFKVHAKSITRLDNNTT